MREVRPCRSGTDGRKPRLSPCFLFREPRENLRDVGFHPVQSCKNPDSLLGRHRRDWQYGEKSSIGVKGAQRCKDRGIADSARIAESKPGPADSPNRHRDGCVDGEAGETELLLRQFGLRQTGDSEESVCFLKRRRHFSKFCAVLSDKSKPPIPTLCAIVAFEAVEPDVPGVALEKGKAGCQQGCPCSPSTMSLVNGDVIQEGAIGSVAQLGHADHDSLLTRDEINRVRYGGTHPDLHGDKFRSTRTSVRDQLRKARIEAAGQQARNGACVRGLRALNPDHGGHRARSGATAARSS